MSTALTRVWVDYNAIEDGQCTTLSRFADGQVFPQERVLTYDHDGNTCEGVVVEADDLLVIALDVENMSSEEPCEDVVWV